MRTNLLHLWSTNVVRQFNGEITTNNAETKKKKISTCRRMHLDLFLTPYTTINSKWIKIMHITQSVSFPSWWPMTFIFDLTFLLHCFKTFNTFVLKGLWSHNKHSVTKYNFLPSNYISFVVFTREKNLLFYRFQQLKMQLSSWIMNVQPLLTKPKFFYSNWKMNKII